MLKLFFEYRNVPTNSIRGNTQISRCPRCTLDSSLARRAFVTGRVPLKKLTRRVSVNVWRASTAPILPRAAPTVEYHANLLLFPNYVFLRSLSVSISKKTPFRNSRSSSAFTFAFAFTFTFAFMFAFAFTFAFTFTFTFAFTFACVRRIECWHVRLTERRRMQLPFSPDWLPIVRFYLINVKLNLFLF